MLEMLTSVNSALNGFVWGPVMLVLLVGTGIYLTCRTGWIQVRRFGYIMKSTVGSLFRKSEKDHGSNLSPFQAVTTALAGTVGTGNIAGVTGAIFVGGPGAVFWMWVSAFFGMCTKYAEIALSIQYRETDEGGAHRGGPMYYIEKGLGRGWKPLAVLFALFGGFASFGIGNISQSSEIAGAMNGLFGIDPLVTGILLAVIVGVVIIGGVKRIGQVASYLVPFMASFYILAGIAVILLRITQVPAALASIVTSAFSFEAVGGGVFGYAIMAAMKQGFARGVFSNEAGLGTGSIAHACADTKKPVKQGFFGIFEVFTDTIVICTLTALVILCSGVTVNYGQAAGAELTISGFTSTYGSWVSIFTAISMCCFAFSTIIGWGLYGARCIEFIFDEKIIKPFMVAYSLVAILGATVDLGLLWSIADTFNGLMAIPNLIGVFLLSKTVFKLTREYFETEGKDPFLS